MRPPVTCSCCRAPRGWCPAWKKVLRCSTPLPARRALRARPTLMLRGILRSPQGPSVLRSEQKGKRLRDRRAVDQFRCAFQRNVCPGSKLWSSDDRSSGEAGARVSGARGISGRAEGAAEIQREIASTAMELKDQMNAADIILDRARKRMPMRPP